MLNFSEHFPNFLTQKQGFLTQKLKFYAVLSKFLKLTYNFGKFPNFFLNFFAKILRFQKFRFFPNNSQTSTAKHFRNSRKWRGLNTGSKYTVADKIRNFYYLCSYVEFFPFVLLIHSRRKLGTKKNFQEASREKIQKTTYKFHFLRQIIVYNWKEHTWRIESPVPVQVSISLTFYKQLLCA